jgi:putative transposase
MTQKKDSATALEWKEILGSGPDGLRQLVQQALQEVLEAEMDETLGAQKSERTPERLGYRSGYYTRTLVTRVGKLVLRVPQDRQGRFRTEVFERYQRSEKALFCVLSEMYIQGVSTRKVKEITEQLCGHEFSPSTISRVTGQLDHELKKFARRTLDEEYPYVVVDARYEKVRQDGVITSQAVQVAIGINWEGRRCVLGVELANRESESSWRQFLLGLKQRGLTGVVCVISDDHAGLRKAIPEVFPEATWQRCYVHFLRNAVDHLPRKKDDDVLTELRWIYERRNVEEARRDLTSWLTKWEPRYPKLCDWAEANIEETLTFYRLPQEHHKHLKSTNMLERINQELKRRTLVVRIFPNADSCLRLIRALAVEIHEDWVEATRYLNMEVLKEQLKEKRRELVPAA